MRRLRAAALLLVAVLALVVPASAVSDHGDPAISRLWVSGDPDKFACTVSYIFPRIEGGSWVLSAGHCAGATLIRRNASKHVLGVVNWRAVAANHNRGPVTDLALGTVPETRDVEKHLWLAEKAPESGAVYIHGFPAGVERVSVGLVVPPAANDRFSVMVPADPWGGVQRVKITELVSDARLLLVKRGEVQGGSSGSPILDESGNVVGVLWGGFTEEWGLEGPRTETYDVAMFTPVERLHKLMDYLGVGR